MIFVGKNRTKAWGEVLIGFGLLFFGLDLLKGSVPDVRTLMTTDPAAAQTIENIIHMLNGHGFGSIVLFLLAGIGLTLMVQSSSAAMAITITCALNGWFGNDPMQVFRSSAAIVLGENIGTTVTAWLAETLVNLGYDPLMVGGGLSNSFVSASLAGNFRPGGGRHVVFEADESDKSLLEYSPDYALILNIGLDHYSKTELIGLFTEFLSKVGKGCVLSKEVRDMLGESAVEHLRVAVFDSEPSKGAVSASGGEESRWTLDSYSTKSTVLSRCFGGDVLGGKSEPFTFSMPSPGRHTAANAMAVLAMIDMLETEPAPSSSVDKGDAPVEIKKNNLSPLLDGDSSFRLDSSISEGASLADSGVYRNWSLFGAAVSSFAGVWRRFDLLGYDSNGAEVRDDYAHNVDKIVSVIKTAKETADRVFVVFQPHGFKPLEFMRGELFEQLEIALSENDEFAFLPVFYAGGTAAFKPTSEEVCADFNRAGTKKYNFFANREDVVCYLEMNTLQNDMVLVLGARDNSLSEFASKIACKKINS
jgi:UDP-N-acetylmuramate-alanine ligase